MSGVGAAPLSLTEEERAWLRDHPVLKLAPDPSFPPIEFFDEAGQYQGLMADYYRLIGDRLGVRFEIVRAKDWNHVLQMAMQRQVDIVGEAQKTAERKQYLQFSQPIIDIPNVIIAHRDSKRSHRSLFDLHGHTVSITSGNALHEYLCQHFPGVDLVPVEDDLNALLEVSFQRVDATVVNLAIASYLIDKAGIANLRVVGDSGRSNPLHIASRNDWPMLGQILEKALASITEEERKGISERWIHLHGAQALMAGRVLKYVLIATLIILVVASLVLAWNYSLRRRVAIQTRALAEELGEREKVEQALRLSEENYREVFDASNDAIFVHDAETGLVLDVNRRALEMYGATRRELLHIDVGLLSEGVPPYTVAESSQRLHRAVVEGPQVFDWRARRLDGSVFWVEVALRSSLISGEPRVLAVVRDITERKQSEERLARYAMHDSLTGLPNRRLLADRVAQTIAVARRHASMMALLFVDLDRFKAINDTYGHGVGDEVLIQVAERLKLCVRNSDTVGRLGGDEFIIVLGGLSEKRHVSKVAQTILDAIGRPYHVAENELTLSVSIGIALYPEDAETVEELIRNSDMAMLAAKASGRRSFRYYDARLDAEAAERMVLQTRLQKAFETGALSLHYQPQVHLGSGHICMVEALLRWQDGEQGFIPPDRFIPVAEETGLIQPIGAWVLQEACRQAMQWQQFHGQRVGVAVNISALQFRQALVDEVRQALETSGLSPELLELELTESVVMRRDEDVGRLMDNLRQLGVKLSIDDFGTGYSSLSYLKTFPLNKLKIDRSFIRDIPVDGNDVQIVQAMLAIANTLNLSVVAEGVESKEQFETLHAMGCDAIQGYYCFRPMTAEAVGEILRQGGRWVAGDDAHCAEA